MFSLRTSQGTFDLDSTESSPTLPASGSMRNGVLYPHARWVHHIDDAACSVWPTPLAADAKRVSEFSQTALYRGYLRGITKASTFGATLTETLSAAGLRQTPNFTEWLMGFPPEWTLLDCEPSETL
jgi:hypothetical protein